MLSDPVMKLTWIRYIIFAVYIIIEEILLTLGVYFYNKSRGVKEKTSFYEFVFFLGIIAIAAYIVKQKKSAASLKMVTDAKKYKAILILIAVAYIAVFIVFKIIESDIISRIFELIYIIE